MYVSIYYCSQERRLVIPTHFWHLAEFWFDFRPHAFQERAFEYSTGKVYKACSYISWLHRFHDAQSSKQCLDLACISLQFYRELWKETYWIVIWDITSWESLSPCLYFIEVISCLSVRIVWFSWYLIYMLQISLITLETLGNMSPRNTYTQKHKPFHDSIFRKGGSNIYTEVSCTSLNDIFWKLEDFSLFSFSHKIK